jgi:sugar/nucleoside kinase (ribokinase family)
MEVALLGPVVKDIITVDTKTEVQIGAPPYYEGVAFNSLGDEATAFVTYAPKDDDWVKNNFKEVKVVNIPVEQTIGFERIYSSSNPDVNQSVKVEYYPNIIKPTENLIKKLEPFDYIIFGPLFHDNTPRELFESLKHKKLVLGNFGMFSYAEKNKLVQKNPENLLNIVPFIEYLFLDEEEITFVGQTNTVEKAVQKIQEIKNICIIVTRASKGSRIFSGDQAYSIPAFPPKKLVDPTGAGDTYLAAFMKATELYKNPEVQGRFAAMVATMSLEKRGAFDSTINEVYKRLKFIGAS